MRYLRLIKEIDVPNILLAIITINLKEYDDEH